MTAAEFLQPLRARVHPLWRMRRSRFFRWCQGVFDFPVARRTGRVTHFTYLLRDFGARIRSSDPEQRTRHALLTLFGRAACDFFVDVGANVGAYSWCIANAHPTAKALLFEPDERNQRLLSRSIARSGLDRFMVCPVALADRSGTARFIVDDASGAVGSLIDQRGGHYNLQDSYRLTVEAEVSTRCLDDYFAELAGHRVLMKVDVEGAEALVFRGAAHVLREVRPLLVFEAFGTDALELLRVAGYHVRPVGENSNYVGVAHADVGLLDGLDLPPDCP